MLDTTDSVCRVVGAYPYAANSSGQLAVNMGSGRPFYFICGQTIMGAVPAVSFAGDNSVMYFQPNGGVQTFGCTIIYGVY